MIRTRYILPILSFTLLLLVALSSCGTTRNATIEAQRQNYMLQDKSEYSRNKGKYKGGASYDRWAKQNKRYLRKQRRR
ncbi:MAG: hypothetical protein JXR52_03765 [Bacteroidales bacterium]|nr:hypothetical protein [Bacteroidales bacterium]